ncbi:MAG TPA: selenium cofactor biosynthesis protein YqeC [Anaerolineales bacterium]
MQLVQALRLGPLPRLGLVGAGGKTSAMFRLARELAGQVSASHGPVLVTTTTHLAVEQLGYGDQHFILQEPGDAAKLERYLDEIVLPEVIVLSGPEGEAGRVAGLSDPVLQVVRAMADKRRLPILVEADGSRRLPLKAPASHEPALPSWTDTVLVVAGLSGLGQPLNPDWVHRSDLFGKLAGIAPGATITPEALAQVLISPKGGLKNIPPQARRIALLNQASTPERQAQARALAQAILPAYQAVIIAALSSVLAGGDEQDETLAVHEQAVGVLLAAGGSQRLGRPKQLLEWRGEPFVRHAARAALAAGLNPVVVVTGAYAAEVHKALAGLPLLFAHNPIWEAGQSSSLAAGLRQLPAETGAAIFLLSDQPQVPPTLLRSLVDLHAHTLAPVVAPQAGGRRANPVLFDRLTFPDLLALQGDTGGRALFSRYPVTWLPWHDSDLLLDVDTEADYQRLLDRMP